MAGMLSMDTYVKGVLDFRGVFYLAFVFIVEIWHDVQSGSGSTLISMSCQTFAFYPSSSDLVDMCPNLWWHNSKETFFVGTYFCDFKISLDFAKHACFICVMSGNVIAFCSLSPKKTVQNPLCKIHVCTKFINIIIENNWSHKYSSNTALYNISMKSFLLLLRIYIWISPTCFSATKCSYATSIYFSASNNEPCVKFVISGVMWQGVPESKIQLVICELSS